MFKSSSRLRSQLLIDPQVQWPILQRTAFYTAACAVYFMVVLFYAESSKINHESPWKSFCQCVDVIACWAPGITMLVPIITYDILIFTNRFAGPMFRLRREMQRLIDDESDQPIKLRDNDHWMDMADLFNELRDEVIALRAARSPMSKSLFGGISEETDEETDSIPTATDQNEADLSEQENDGDEVASAGEQLPPADDNAATQPEAAVATANSASADVAKQPADVTDDSSESETDRDDIEMESVDKAVAADSRSELTDEDFAPVDTPEPGEAAEAEAAEENPDAVTTNPKDQVQDVENQNEAIVGEDTETADTEQDEELVATD